MHDTSTQLPQESASGPPPWRYLTLESLGLEAASLDFYQLLLSCTGEDAAAQMHRHAMHFRMNGCGRASFVARLDALPAPLARFPLWRTELEGLPGDLPAASLLERVQGALGQPLHAFLASPGWKTAQADIWQSLLALTLTSGQLAEAALMLQLTDVLRVGHFLRVLDGGLCSLAGHAERRAVLGALLVLPEGLAPLPR